MRNIAEFQIIGRLGRIKRVGSTIRLTIAANYPSKDDNGGWKYVTYWNEIVVFDGSTHAYIEEHAFKGDLVHARGRLRQGGRDAGEACQRIEKQQANKHVTGQLAGPASAR